MTSFKIGLTIILCIISISHFPAFSKDSRNIVKEVDENFKKATKPYHKRFNKTCINESSGLSKSYTIDLCKCKTSMLHEVDKDNVDKLTHIFNNPETMAKEFRHTMILMSMQTECLEYLEKKYNY